MMVVRRENPGRGQHAENEDRGQRDERQSASAHDQEVERQRHDDDDVHRQAGHNGVRPHQMGQPGDHGQRGRIHGRHDAGEQQGEAMLCRGFLHHRCLSQSASSTSVADIDCVSRDYLRLHEGRLGIQPRVPDRRQPLVPKAPAARGARQPHGLFGGPLL
ncbi:MAG: hypothetical protein A2V63_04345 [Candidatus Eisenbacteria bacterium RBG_19FT_COMBO_70_11]|nr:MAG: hypothetical protein A2V63_04345 [Candidatus Eisenbacteria bacterium RBG_19FT_COMBO_70_11]